MSTSTIIPGSFLPRPHLRPRRRRAVTAPVRRPVMSPRSVYKSYACASHRYVSAPSYANQNGMPHQCPLCQYHTLREQLMQNKGVMITQPDTHQPAGTRREDDEDDTSAICVNRCNSDHDDDAHELNLSRQCPSLENLDVHYQLQPREYVIASARSEPAYLRSYLDGYRGPRSGPGHWRDLPNYQRRNIIPMLTTRENVNVLVNRLMKPTESTKAKTSTRRKLIDAYNNRSIVPKPSAVQSYMDSVKIFS